MQRTSSRMLSLKAQIKRQIEIVAEQICTGVCAVGAMQVLDDLTHELVEEEVRTQAEHPEFRPPGAPESSDT